MGRARKHHQQLELPKLDKNGQRRGGKRKNAGRPCNGARPGAPHKRRPILKSRYPVHVVLRVHEDIGNLRKRHMYRALREATITVALRGEQGAFRIIHISIQRLHVHLLVEAQHQAALSSGMQSFQISAAKHLNRAVSVGRPERRRGTVFPDRFHQQIITNGKQARNTLSYVLNNWRKHGEDRAKQARDWKVDPYSTAVLFPGWKERADQWELWYWRDTYDPLCVYTPSTWLLKEVWRSHGLISYDETPSLPACQQPR